MEVTEYEEIWPKHLKMLIYGHSDAGKTVLGTCSDDLNPAELKVIDDVLFLDFDFGTVSQLDMGAGILVKNQRRIHTRNELNAALTHLSQNKGKYKYVVIDTIDSLQEMLKEDERGAADKLTQGGWGNVIDRMVKILRMMDTWETSVIAFAHVAEREDFADNKRTKDMPLIDAKKLKNTMTMYFDHVSRYEVVQDLTTNPITDIYRLHLKGDARMFGRSRIKNVFGVDFIDNPTIPAMEAKYQEVRSAKLDVLRQLEG